MLVKDLMKKPYVLEKDVSVYEVAKIMSSDNVDLIIYSVKGDVKGIVTHEAVLKNFNAKKNVSQIVKKNFVSIDKDETLDYALSLMKKNSVKRLPVFNNYKIVGVINVLDIALNSAELEEEFLFE